MSAVKVLGEKNRQRNYEFAILIEVDTTIPDLIQWGHENLRSPSWTLTGLGTRSFSHVFFSFNDDTDAMLIRLRWPDCDIAEFDAAGCLI